MNEYIPLNCVWEMTLQCTMKCLHCGSNAGKKRDNELNLDECMRTADELIDLGCKKISLIGGEIFLYKGWELVAKRLSDNGVLANIITNGYQLGDKEIQQIKYAGLTNVCLSVDGMEKNHNRIRNKAGSFKRVLDGFKRLKSEGIPYAVVTTLLDFNFYDLEEMYDLFLKNEVSAWQIQLANLMGNMSENKSLEIKRDKIPLVIEFIKEKKDENKMNIYAADDIGYYHEYEKYIRGKCGEISFWPGCQAGLTVVGIDSIGNVKGCESLYADEFIEGNIRKRSLHDIWHDKDNFLYNRKFNKNNLSGNCAQCDMGDFCRGGCKGNSFFNKGYLFENPYCAYNVKKIA
jgi:radical SAM protein with 4Fe4S-binding SPASM domain